MRLVESPGYRRRHMLAVVFGIAVAPFVLPNAGQSQTLAQVHGVVLDARSGKPVSAALVRVEDSGPAAETSDRGRFTLPGVPSGRHTIVVQRLGYETRREILELNPGTSVDVEIRLSTKPVALDPIDVVVRSGRLSEVGYYDRRDNGGISGHYLTYDDLVHRNAMGLTDVLDDVPGVRTVHIQPGRTTVRFNRHVPEVASGSKRGSLAFQASDPIPGCEPDLYIDGRLYRNASPPIIVGRDKTSMADETVSKVDDFNAIPVSEIAGVEIYVGAAVPPFVHNTACGVILLWTRR